MAEDREIRGSLLLCDFAESLNGKLYIMGGGWTRLNLAPTQGDIPTTADMGLAAIIGIPWGRTNERLRMSIRLVTEDGHPCLDADNRPVAVEGEIEVGRPPGIRRGIPQSVTFAVKAGGVVVNAGEAYAWILEVGPDEIARTSFEVAGPPLGPGRTDQ